MDEETLVFKVESKDSFTEAETSMLLKEIAKCIREGSPASYFSASIDKLLSNVMTDRNPDLEKSWQDAFEKYDG